MSTQAQRAAVAAAQQAVWNAEDAYGAAQAKTAAATQAFDAADQYATVGLPAQVQAMTAKAWQDRDAARLAEAWAIQTAQQANADYGAAVQALAAAQTAAAQPGNVLT